MKANIEDWYEDIIGIFSSEDVNTEQELVVLCSYIQKFCYFHEVSPLFSGENQRHDLAI